MEAQQLENCDLIEAKDALGYFNSGWSLSPVGDAFIITEDFVKNYEGKLWSVSRYKTEHAVRLHQSTLEFYTNIRSKVGSEMSFLTLAGNEEHHYLIAQVLPEGKVIGCMRAINQTRVSPERWAAIWGTSA